MEDKDSGLSDQEMAEHEYKLDKKLDRALDYIKQNISIKGFEQLIGPDLWLREVLKDVSDGTPNIRSRALMMLGQYLGILSNRARPGRKMNVEISEDVAD